MIDLPFCVGIVAQQGQTRMAHPVGRIAVARQFHQKPRCFELPGFLILRFAGERDPGNRHCEPSCLHPARSHDETPFKVFLSPVRTSGEAGPAAYRCR